MATIPVEWFRDAPEAFAKADRKRRNMNALGQIAGVPGNMTRNYGAYQQSEDEANANQAALTERLNYANAQAHAAGRPLEENAGMGTVPGLSPGMLGPTPPVPSGGGATAPSGTAPSAQPSSIKEEPLGPSKTSGPISSAQPVSGLPEEGGLSRFARGAAAVLFGANIPRPGRAVATGKMLGTVQRRQDELLALRAMNPLWRYATQPSAGMRQVAPDWNIPDMERVIPGAANANKPTAWSTLQQAYGGDPKGMLGGYRDYIRQPFPMGGETEQQTIHEELNPETGQWEEKPKPPSWALPKPGVQTRDRKITRENRGPGGMPAAPQGGASSDPGAQFGIPFLR